MRNRMLTLAAVAVGGAFLAKQLQKTRARSEESVVKESLDVDVALGAVYDQWTQFEDFPRFMESVHEVRQLDDKRLHWKADVFGKPIEWDAEIIEQIPDQKIAWHSIAGTPNGGAVTFKALSSSRTRITLEMSYVPQDTLEALGDAAGAVRLQARTNLKRFKEFIEQRGRETGAWRGTIPRQSESRPLT